MSSLLHNAAIHMPHSLRALWQRWVEPFPASYPDIEDASIDAEDSSDLGWTCEQGAAENCLPSDSCRQEVPLATPTGSAGLLEVVFGPQWLADEALAAECRALSESVLAGDQAAAQLVGQLLVFHTAPSERLATVLKDLGESYYKWRHQCLSATDTFALALVTWVNQRCAAAGSSNRIERVEPGDRFDGHRHQSVGRGTTVSQALGWVVARTDGKVYSRAQVTVR